MNTKEARTRRLIAEIKLWVTKKQGEINYFITLGLSEHRCVGVYLKRMGKQDNENCWYCQDRNTPEHTLFIWEKWAEDRNKVETNIGEKITSVNLMIKMLLN